MREIIWRGLRVLPERGPERAIKLALNYARRDLVEKSRVQFLFEKKGKTADNESDGLSVLFITTYGGTSPLYRAINQREQLLLNGVRCGIKPVYDINLLNYANNYGIFIFQSTPYSKPIERMIQKIHEMGKVAICDFDDLVFSPRLVKNLAVAKTTTISLKNLAKLKTLMEKCDYSLTTTGFLAETLREQGQRVFINRNALGSEQIKISEQAIRCKSPSNKVRIGYFSGGPIHDHDFLKITEPLTSLMAKYDYIELWIGGYLNLSPKFDHFQNRIKRIPFVPWKKLPYQMAKVDINLAPLDIENPFSQSKSEVKYIEAGILGIPTIASPSDAYKFAIRHGENGLLASNPEEWIRCLESLILSQSERERIGSSARQYVKAFYSPDYRGKEFVEILKHIMTSEG